VDLAKAHVQACKRLIEQKAETNFEVFNIGTGKGTSVLEMIHAFENITGVKLNYTIGPRREGDAPSVFASTNKANELLNWKAELDLGKMIATAWNWQLKLNHHELTKV
jgi:UDP-glucose 4-epimerase